VPASPADSVFPQRGLRREDPNPELAIDAALVRKDHRRALELLARGYGSALGRLCMATLGSRAEAEELAQEILLQAHAALPGFERRSSAKTWLFTIARRCCAQTLERRARRRRLLRRALPELDRDATPDPCGELEARGRGERLRSAREELSAGVREVMLLRYSADLSFREVAHACGIREDAARQRASAGLRLLRRRLEADAPRAVRPPRVNESEVMP
jgi:RNA polymerase sigma-70 factor (ECF subfamily)